MLAISCVFGKQLALSILCFILETQNDFLIANVQKNFAEFLNCV